MIFMAKRIRIIIQFLVSTQIWVSFCFVALAMFFQFAMFGEILKINFLLFFSCLAVYNAAYLLGGNIAKNLFFTILGIVGVLLSLYFLSLKIESFLLLILLSIIGLGYTYANLRSVPYLKIYSISLVWALSIVGVPAIQHGVGVDFHVISMFVICFLWVLGVTVPFDVRDMHSDVFSLKTLPQVLGAAGAMLVARSVLFVSVVCFSLVVGWSVASIAFGLSLLVAFVLLDVAKLGKAYYVSFGVEGLSMLPLCFYLALNMVKDLSINVFHTHIIN
ncbi:hypothetical protein EDM00_04925 [Ornithobacterium rhinotracheale]|nr:hypothetical protein [Ornithobacterium rhinotracheale]